MIGRRDLLAAGALAATGARGQAQGGAVKYVRFRTGSKTAYGILEGDTIRELSGPLFGAHKETGGSHKLAGVKLLYPCEPPKVLAVGLNYKSHIGNRPVPANPEIFYKPITSLQNPEDPIVVPRGAENVHFEGELVVVIGKTAKAVSATQAREAIFGVTCGNDVSERDWQNGPQKDLQWWRAKGADTFAPMGPAIVRGLDYGKLQLETRLNGKVVQKQSTSDLVFDCSAIVSFVSQYVTLTPGDVIYTGTPGATSRMKAGDTVEVEIEGIGVLRNRVAGA
jgi:2-keto-4-pentenoate hydratase/2-oxohepta-3-ene-1,7-dioic acid hydratase in catechol pathway